MLARGYVRTRSAADILQIAVLISKPLEGATPKQLLILSALHTSIFSLALRDNYAVHKGEQLLSQLAHCR